MRPPRLSSAKANSHARLFIITVSIGDAPEFEWLLAQRIYEYNAAATGYRDGESFIASYENEAGTIEAGASGYGRLPAALPHYSFSVDGAKSSSNLIRRGVRPCS